MVPISLPYIKGLSENVACLFRSNGIPSYYKPTNTIKNHLVKPKDQTPKEKQCGLVYDIKCFNCNQYCIGETGRNLGVRFKEHTSRKGVDSSVKEHIREHGHECRIEEVKVLDREDNWLRRKIKEAIYINRNKPELNRDQGLELPPVYSTLLSRDLHGSRDDSVPSQRH